MDQTTDDPDPGRRPAGRVLGLDLGDARVGVALQDRLPASEQVAPVQVVVVQEREIRPLAMARREVGVAGHAQVARRAHRADAPVAGSAARDELPRAVVTRVVAHDELEALERLRQHRVERGLDGVHVIVREQTYGDPLAGGARTRPRTRGVRRL